MLDLVDLKQSLLLTDEEYDTMKKADKILTRSEQAVLLPIEEEGADIPTVRNYPSHPT